MLESRKESPEIVGSCLSSRNQGRIADYVDQAIVGQVDCHDREDEWNAGDYGDVDHGGPYA